MFSDLLKKDIRQYAAKGVDFTPEDIVRLNALAVRVKLSQHPCSGVGLPRCVFLPPVDAPGRCVSLAFFGRELVLREPTIAHELWLEEAARWIDVADERNFLFLHAFALSFLDPAKLPDAFAPRRVIKAVYTFAAKRLVRYTAEQLRNAVDYALFGADWAAGEVAVKSASETGGPRPVAAVGCADATGRVPPSPTLGLLTRARALRHPISLDDARRMTASELAEAVNAAIVGDDAFDAKRARHEAMGDYIRTRDAIIARIKETHRPGASEPGGKEAGDAK